MPRIFAGLLFAFVALYQVRSGLDSIHNSRTLDFEVPFTIEPFTAKVDRLGWKENHEPGGGSAHLQEGDEILAINGKPFDGFSQFQRAIPAGFTVTVRSEGSKIRQLRFSGDAHHCTCGVPTLTAATLLFLIAPLFCVMLGFAMAALLRRPGGWMFLLLMFSLSQLQFWPEQTGGLQYLGSVMRWDDWMRVPAVAYRAFAQNIWPAALVGSRCGFLRRRSGWRCSGSS